MILLQKNTTLKTLKQHAVVDGNFLILNITAQPTTTESEFRKMFDEYTDGTWFASDLRAKVVGDGLFEIRFIPVDGMME